MSEIAIRKQEQPSPLAAPATAPTTYTAWPRWSPRLSLRDLMAWDPFREMVPTIQTPSADFAPAFEVKEDGQGFTFKVDLPGMKESDIQLTLNGDRLTVSGKREAERRDKGETYYLYERSYGSFLRTFTLPTGADTASTHAELKDGVLTITVNKRPEAQPQKIAVQTK